jgi:hypothetical protein
MTAEVASYNALVAYTPVDDMRVGSYNALIAFTIPDEVSLASYNALIAYYIEEQANSNLTIGEAKLSQCFLHCICSL